MTRPAAVATTALLVAGALVAVDAARAPEAQAVPADFQDQVLWTGFTAPTEVAFADDGAVFVAEKSGLVYRFDGLDDTERTQVADLRDVVHNWADRGLLGLAVDPDFGPDRPFVYVQYTYDSILGSDGPVPRWGAPGETFDGCPDPPGRTRDGCVVSGRLSKLVLSAPDGGVVREDVLVEDWCAQFPSHSIGTIAFGDDGYLYAGGGDGASFNLVDWGQRGGSPGSPTPVNPCGDGVPPGTQPTAAEGVGGAIRSQAPGVGARSTVTGDVTLSGSIIRVDPDTGEGVPGNPWFDRPGATANEQRIVAYGFRNQFRFSLRGGSNEAWIGDVGWNRWEEINRLPDPSTLDEPLNYGWPCYEGPDRQGGYDGADIGVCEDLYAAGPSAVEEPYYAYRHDQRPTADEPCPTGGSSIAGVAYYDRPTGPGVTPYPERYDGAVFFTDYNRRCVWAMLPGADGQPDPGAVEFFHDASGGIVNLVVGPDGDLFYPNIDRGQIHRIAYVPDNTPPVADLVADPTVGPAPLTVSFDASGSVDADGDDLTFAWDLDGDGEFDDADGPTTSRTYDAGEVTVGVRVTDAPGASDVATTVVSAGNAAPTVTITSPDPGLTWRVGQEITFSGEAVDPEDGPLTGSDLSWLVRLLTCDDTGTDCVTRNSDPFTGASGSVVAPDWSGEGNNLLELQLTATDSAGVQTVEAVRLVPETVTLTFDTDPSGLDLTVGADTRATPFTRTVIVGSESSLSAPSPQTLDGTPYVFDGWTDGGGADRVIAAPAEPTTYTATYAADSPGGDGLVAEYGFDERAGTVAGDSSGRGNDGQVAGAGWTGDGRFGGALSFDGSSSQVVVPDAPSLDLGSEATLTAWVRPAALTWWETVVLKEDPGASDLAYALYAGSPGGGPGGYVRPGGQTAAATVPDPLPTGEWTHVATTYDGDSVDLYLDGTLAASRPATGSLPGTSGPLVVGGNGIWGEWFDGEIDEVRVYDRALGEAELAAERLRPVTDDAVPPTVSLEAPAAGETVSGVVGLSATAADDAGLAAVTFLADGEVVAEVTTAPYAAPWSTGGVPNGEVTVTAVARDRAGNTAEDSVTVTVDNQAPAGPVAAYGFDAGTGDTVVDSSAAGNDGTASGAARVPDGRFGGALAFDGTASRVVVPDDPSLDLATGLTVMAWVRPDTVTGWRTVVLKEDPARGDLAYGLYAGRPGGGGGGWVVSGPGAVTEAAASPAALPANEWTHVAATYDGSTLRYYEDGALVATQPAGGAVLETSGPLSIGGNGIWGEWFDGEIDEVRVYDRALSVSEVGTARLTPV